MQTVILEIVGLNTHFPLRNALGLRQGVLRAVHDVSLSVCRGDIVAVVGESGCGKTTLGKTVTGIHKPTSGNLLYQGKEINWAAGAASKRLRRVLQYSYQDPGSSLDPRWKIGRSLEEPLVIHEPGLNSQTRKTRVNDVLASMRVPLAHVQRYPHEISGGQKRRIGIARILMTRPEIVVLDEPTAGLDVSVQAAMLQLLLDLRRELSLTYLFISHDLSVVRLVADRVVVMYLGSVVEEGDTRTVFGQPKHPYTQSLIDAVPVVGGKKIADRTLLQGDPPSPVDRPAGCAFHSRCPRAMARCQVESPTLKRLADGTRVACHLF